METTTKIRTEVYEIKVSGKWSKVRATSMIALNKWCEEMGIKGWRSVGMMSIGQSKDSQSLTVVA